MAKTAASLERAVGGPRPAIRLVIAAVIVLAGYAASLAVNLPGHFSPDSLWQLAQGRSGVYDDWHPPIMAWFLGLTDRMVPGAPLFIVFNGAMFYGGLLAWLCLERRPRLISLPVVGLIMVSPIVLIYQGIVWKDVLFANASMAGFAVLAWAARFWGRQALRRGALALAFALFCLACLSRQNGAIVPLCGVAALFAIGWTAERGSRTSKAVVGRPALRALLAAVLAALTVGSVDLGLALHGDGEPQARRQLERLQVYDLAGAVRADPAADLSILRQRDPVLEGFIRRQAAPAWLAAGADNLADLPGGRAKLSSSGQAVMAQWAALIVDRPALYLAMRARVFLAVLLTPEADACPMVVAGVDPGNRGLLAAAGLRARYNAKDQWDDAYESSFIGTPVFSHLLYGVLAMILAGWAIANLRRGPDRGELIAVAAMVISALLATASFFVISNACDYRYLYFLDVAAMAALVHRAARRGDVTARNKPSDS